jgi:hypothetical protein
LKDRGHNKVFLAAPRTPSSASEFLRVTFSQPAFTAVTRFKSRREGIAFEPVPRISRRTRQLRARRNAAKPEATRVSRGARGASTSCKIPAHVEAKLNFLVPVLVSVGFQTSCQSVFEGSKREPHEILASIGLLANCAKLSASVRRSQN